MNLVNHGGLCCGIKTIYGLDVSPDKKSFYPYDPERASFPDWDQRAIPTKTNQSIFTESFAKGDILGEIFDRMIAVCKKERKSHLIEVNLILVERWEDWDQITDEDKIAANYQDYGDHNQARWVPFLKARGFRCVSKWINSNSGNLLGCFHLNYGVL